MIKFCVDEISIKPKLGVGSYGMIGIQVSAGFSENQLRTLFTALLEQYGDEEIMRIIQDASK